MADFLAYIPSWWKNQPWLVRVGGGCTPTPFYSTCIFHHVYAKLQCTLQLRGHTQSMYFISTPIQYRYVLCSLMFLSDFFLCIYPSETVNKSILLSLPTKFKFRCFYLLVISFFWSVHCNFVYTWWKIEWKGRACWERRYATSVFHLYPYVYSVVLSFFYTEV
jgi:hypothetical protein